MITLFRPIPLYIKLYINKVEVTRLDNKAMVTRYATESFSNPRIVLADFYNAEQTVRTAIKELIAHKGFFQPTYRIVIQQMEKFEGGLSDIERRGMYDLAEGSDGIFVIVLEHHNELSPEQALLELKKK